MLATHIQAHQEQHRFYSTSKQNHNQPQYPPAININTLPQTYSQPQQQWSSSAIAATIPSPAHSQYSDVTTAANDFYSFGTDQPLFDFQPQHYKQYNSNAKLNLSPLMQSEHSNNTWLSHGQLTPTSTTRAHHRESSLSSLGSAGPASPAIFNTNTSNPQVASDYHDLYDYQQSSSKPLTPVHTPSQEQFLNTQYNNVYANSNLAYSMSHDGFPKTNDNVELMPAPEFKTEYNGHSGRPSIASVASHDSPSTPPVYEVEERQRAYRTQMPKLDRTMTDVYADELYNPNFQYTSAPPSSAPSVSATSPQNDVFMQRLQAANNEHINSSTSQTPLTIPSRERSPFRRGSPLAPTGNGFGGSRFGNASQQRERIKMENDANMLHQQTARTVPEQNRPNTVSPKDVDLVYHESEEDSSMPLFPPSQQQQTSSVYRQQPSMAHDTSDLDDNASQHSYNSMATSRRQSSSAFSTSSQLTQQQGTFNFTPPSVPGTIRQIPQQYPFVPATRRQLTSQTMNLPTEPPALPAMESSSSDNYFSPDSDAKKPEGTSADTGTYTCTYHGCTLRFETPSKLQRHKREGHRNSASLIASGEDSGMTSAALRNTQNGPHKCERINPSTGKPCNTIFSRPYDLTRHEDTIHNARKQKVRCHLCTEEKTFSRNDALTRHFRVCHPDHPELHKTRRRGGRD